MRIETAMGAVAPKTYPALEGIPVGGVFRRVSAVPGEVGPDDHPHDPRRLFMRTANHSRDPVRQLKARAVALDDGATYYMSLNSRAVPVEGTFLVTNWGGD